MQISLRVLLALLLSVPRMCPYLAPSAPSCLQYQFNERLKAGSCSLRPQYFKKGTALMVGQDGMGIPAYRNQEEERHPTAPKGADYLNSADRKAAEIGERVLSRLQSKILIIVTQVVLIGSVNPLQVKRARLGIVFGMCKRCLRIGEPKR
jgi:hypothetical protein